MSFPPLLESGGIETDISCMPAKKDNNEYKKTHCWQKATTKADETDRYMPIPGNLISAETTYNEPINKIY
jgi:hypothetical protein